jgi:hypothetical protein
VTVVRLPQRNNKVLFFQAKNQYYSSHTSNYEVLFVLQTTPFFLINHENAKFKIKNTKKGNQINLQIGQHVSLAGGQLCN